ncbi:MAG: prefoldin subunit alpha [Candidatus Woesearchaeota archaeon]
MNEEEKKKKLQEKYYEFQVLKQHLEEIQQQKQILSQKGGEISKAGETLDDLGDVKEGKDVFAQLGGGMFIRTSLKNNKEVLMDAGANVLVSKKIPEAKKFMDEKVKEVGEALKNIDEALEKAGGQLQVLQKEIISLSEGK